MKAEDYGVSESAMAGEIERRAEREAEREEAKPKRRVILRNVEQTILTALRAHADEMKAAGDGSRKNAALPDQRKPQSDPMVIDITPTPEGFATMGALFAEQEANARAIADRIEDQGLLFVARDASPHVAVPLADLAVRALLDAIDPDTLEAIAEEIGDEFKHSARADSLRVIARKQREALEEAEVR